MYRPRLGPLLQGYEWRPGRNFSLNYVAPIRLPLLNDIRVGRTCSQEQDGDSDGGDSHDVPIAQVERPREPLKYRDRWSCAVVHYSPAVHSNECQVLELRV
jgi:hypothetical protein